MHGSTQILEPSISSRPSSLRLRWLTSFLWSVKLLHVLSVVFSAYVKSGKMVSSGEISNNIKTVIELLDKNRCVLVAMSCDVQGAPIEHAELRSSLIGLVRHLQQQHCPRLNVCEFSSLLTSSQAIPLWISCFSCTPSYVDISASNRSINASIQERCSPVIKMGMDSSQ